MDTQAKYDKIKHRTFQSLMVAEFLGVSQRTIQAWTKRGLVEHETKGKGARKEFTVDHLIEFGIIKKLADLHIPFSHIESVMVDFRKKKYIQATMRLEQFSLIVYESQGKEPKIRSAGFFPGNKKTMLMWVDITAKKDVEKTTIFNLPLLANTIINNIYKGIK